MIIELNENNFYESVSKGLKIVEFYTNWCGFCSKQNAVLNEMDNITIYKINADEAPSIVRKYGIHSFPSFIIFKNGKDIHQFSGLHNKFELMSIITRFMK